mmetsp:Transcript_81783/g.189973  ORF Transcript_81783/g.189973 Transcript_81783/m.189973 type:complete len:316 (+) Transcript_81783:67-1014(+)
MCTKFTAAKGAAKTWQPFARSTDLPSSSCGHKVRSREPCMRYLNELGRDFEWRRGAHFRTLEELTRDFEGRKAKCVSPVAPPPGLEPPREYGREELLSVLAALPQEPGKAALGIRCVPGPLLAAGGNGCSYVDSFITCSRGSSAEGSGGRLDTGRSCSRGSSAEGSRACLSKLGEEAEGCPSTASGGEPCEPSEGGSLDSEEPWLAAGATWEPWLAEGVSWEKVPLGMQDYPELWYPSWGGCWDLGDQQQPWCVVAHTADPTLLSGANLSPEPCWSGTHQGVDHNFAGMGVPRLGGTDWSSSELCWSTAYGAIHA